MVLRVDIVRVIFLAIVLILSTIAIILLIKYNSEILSIIIASTCFALIIALLIKLFYIPNHIIIKDNKIKVFDFPLFATNKFYVKKRGLILYNSEIEINDIEDIQLIILTREEQNKYIGYKHLSKKYLKFTLKYGNPKFVCVGIYSKQQIKQIIKTCTKVS